jgi:biotin transport system substrate-specific component
MEETMLKIPQAGAAPRSFAQHVAFLSAAVLLGSVILTLSARLQVPFWPVPMTLQTLAVLVIGATFGSRLGAVVVGAYVLEGLLGLPVFAGTPERGLGLAYLFGPTGGYLAGFVAAAYLAGWLAERGYNATLAKAVFVQAVGTALILAAGCAWLAVLVGPEKALAAGLLPFLASSLVKIGLGAALVVAIGRRR